MRDIRVFDDFIGDPEDYRRDALALEYRTQAFEHCAFHGIAAPPAGYVPLRITERFPAARPTLSFFRKSPAGQIEPHYIHTDTDMGDWTGILYLNPMPPLEDGTLFWQHVATGDRASSVPNDARLAFGRDLGGWRKWRSVRARFNRMVVFPAEFFHSRAVYQNYGEGENARLIQVVFGEGDLWQ